VVAYNIFARFAEAVEAGTKVLTVRGPRRRHARPGEELQLYTGMRTRQCRLLRRAPCLFVGPVLLRFGADPAVFLGEDSDGPALDLEVFAREMGYAGWAALAAQWPIAAPEQRAFLIRWAA